MPLKPREGALHAFHPQASCLLITLLSSSPRLPLGHPAFLATFGILLNTCDLWPLPSGLPTHLSPQLLPLLNSVRLAPPPVIKRRTFQVDTFPLSRPCVASPGAGQVSGPPRASWDCRQGQSLALLQFKSIRQNQTRECHRCGSTQAQDTPPTPHTTRHGSSKHPATRASPGFRPPRCTSDRSDFLSFSGSLCDVGTIVLISEMRNQGFGDMKAVA